MDRDLSQLDGGGSFAISDSETSQSEASEPGSPLAAHWDDALTEALPSAANQARSQNHANQAIPWPPQGWDETMGLTFRSLIRLPALPMTLQELRAGSNFLTSLPELPAGLQRLWVGRNQLTSLPQLPATLEELNVTYNQLTSLPSLPAGLRLMLLGRNQLTSLPTLPTELRDLSAPNNQLTSLPALPANLETLNVSNNQLTEMPEPLPSRMEILDADDNQLVRLPELPAGLERLDVSHNQLTEVPASLLQLRSNALVDLRDNPLQEPVQSDLARATTAAGYAGPRIRFAQSAVLPEILQNWLREDPTTLATWRGFAGEPGAQDYARFLVRLAGTVNNQSDEFRQAVGEDLRQAAARPRLRELFFQLASDACASCEDRVTLTWNGMQSARLNADIEDGLYDDRLPELLQHARVMFRMEALDGIARQTVNELNLTLPADEVEVYLAYQNQLREPLELHHVAADMRFLTVAHVSSDHLERAIVTVREQEETGFADYLATRWQPWESVLRRIAPEDHAAMEQRLVDAMDDEFQTRLNQRLLEAGLMGDADAERTLGPDIVNEIAREIKGEVMHRVLRANGIEL
ncbi:MULTISPECIES: NEL-type E3 ubiquitin ligase domain-containing protein [Bradyrhizobium]|uniref:NEL-type E3 ubiquitin ligase domain-containing protein n=1 Tax=Bradyrhizobium TaxID=374 RepID=UPI0008420F15|nr:MULTISPECIES: NEL-type E3 ubiquitin ligase domain-containing protein [Bradyrhizobium]MCP1838875.1 hypothetical protein [Bradyrhizobium sp. USDA 4538]MCP1899442.1 hypothetical protein [Bradyrhizobium sp. USDA 4537]MCP1986447.1 hypothetical protein [Bradyrhizobium sp. USDA 4539]ODM75105.1 hypothetical protein A6452_39405 [Bradyrhizobium elkanii]ODM82710.1 hypothetical protein A6X20_16360 [Bradyrhizobium elkanii]